MTTILITGVKGFIASNVVEHFAGKEDYTLMGYEGLSHDMGKVNWHLQPDIILHLGAEAGVRRSHEEPDLFWKNNVDGFQAILDLAKDFVQTPRVIYASSSSIYDWHMSPYATTKKINEQMANQQLPNNSLGLRFHTVYGKNSRTDMFFDKVINHPDTIDYVTDHERDWTHVEDVVSAIEVIIEKGQHLNGAIDVGCGTPCSVADMVKYFTGKDDIPTKEVTGEREKTHAKPTELLELGWKPKHYILTENPKDYETI
jgi:nucleoside-diphosphate-sugar epimerase